MNESDSIEKTTSDKVSEMSLKKGYEFYFYDEGKEIYAHGSSWSGKETITVDGKEVNSLRNFGRCSVHRFNIEQDQYEIEFNMVKLMTGELHCTLIKNDLHFKTLKLSIRKSPGSLFKYVIGGFVIGFVVGFAVVKILKYWV